MPTYEFRCPDGHEFEKFYRKISDATSELPCPVCGKVATRLVSGGAGLLFKGSGFYLTDYGKNAHRKASPSGNSDKAGESTTSGDSKPDAKSGETKSSETKRSETKRSETKRSESKPAAESTPAKKPSSGSKSDT
jgi:putative FmdB family regulatory protein